MRFINDSIVLRYSFSKLTLFLCVILFSLPAVANIPPVIYTCLVDDTETIDPRIEQSWQEYAPDFQIRKITPNDLPISRYPAIKTAYEQKQYDVVRLFCAAKILSERGGLYLDPHQYLHGDPSFLMSDKESFSFAHNRLLTPTVIAAEKKSPTLSAIMTALLETNAARVPAAYTLTTLVFKHNTLLKKDGQYQSTTDGLTLYPANHLFLNMNNGIAVSSYAFSNKQTDFLPTLTEKTLKNLFLKQNAVPFRDDGKLKHIYRVTPQKWYIAEDHTPVDYVYHDDETLGLHWKKGWTLFLKDTAGVYNSVGNWRVPTPAELGHPVEISKGP